jgi:hypothetical protein
MTFNHANIPLIKHLWSIIGAEMKHFCGIIEAFVKHLKEKN